MNKRNKKLPKAQGRGRIDVPVDRRIRDIPTHGRGGNIQTNWANIRWTKKKITFVSLSLATPYVIALIVSWVAIDRLITYILLGLAVMCGLIVLFLRSMDNEEF